MTPILEASLSEFLVPFFELWHIALVTEVEFLSMKPPVSSSHHAVTSIVRSHVDNHAGAVATNQLFVDLWRFVPVAEPVMEVAAVFVPVVSVMPVVEVAVVFVVSATVFVVVEVDVVVVVLEFLLELEAERQFEELKHAQAAMWRKNKMMNLLALSCVVCPQVLE
jgi:hypothetical protein